MDTSEVTTPAARSSEAAELWNESFQGEVLGEAYFSRMRDLAQDEGEKAKIDHLVRLERCTKEMLVPYLRRHGLSTDPDQGVVQAMAAIDSYDWTSMLEGVRPVAATFLAKYRRLAELVAPEDRPATEALVAHELALDDFCRRELESLGGSLDSILALAHVR